MNTLYQVFISPIEAVMALVLTATYSATGHYGASILILSLCVNLALLPLYHIADKWQQAERDMQSRLRPRIREFQQAFSGEERFMMIRALYRQEGYHPIYALRASLGFLIQVPFFIAAYHLLAHYQPLKGAFFFIFEDLSKPDALLWGINVMPFVMTAVNLLSAFVYTQRLSLPDKIQLWFISLLFLVVLYSSPVALLIYWTFNNVFSLLKNLAYSRSATIQTTDVGQVGSMASLSQGHRTSKSDLRKSFSQTRREFLPLCQKTLESPYVLALFAGLWPIAFYISNNWFMFEAYRNVFIVVIFTSIIWLTLSMLYLALSWLLRRVFNPNEPKTALRIFVFVSILVMAYLLRRTFLPMVGNREFAFLVIAMLTALTVGWLIPRIQIYRVNIVLGSLCILHVVMGMSSVISTKLSPTILFDPQKGAQRQAIYDQVRFSMKPNVYYIVPDGYPNAEALRTVFDLDGTDLHEHLKAFGFTIYPSAFSNYIFTLASMGSVLGMDHHYYRGNIGNFEFLNARRFMVSEQNPVVKIFRNNGYQVHYVHEDGFMFLNGCFIDSCSPMVFWGEVIDILVPPSLKSIPLLGGVTERITAKGGSHDDKQVHSEFMQRVLAHIDFMSRQHTPHFTYIHSNEPGHNFLDEPTSEQLTSFRKDYVTQIQFANDQALSVVPYILTRDPTALIIVNGDHGACGYGSFNYTKKDMLGDTPDDIIALDHLGVLLAIRWPDGAPHSGRGTRTLVNLFRHIFSYLSESGDILATTVADDGFIARGWGAKQTVWKALHDGEVLQHRVEMEPMTERAASRK